MSGIDFWVGDWVRDMAPPTGLECRFRAFRGFMPAVGDLLPPDRYGYRDRAAGACAR